MADLLTKVRAEIEGRLGELRPLLSEYERLLATADALAVADGKAKPPRRRGRRGPAPEATGRAVSSTALGGARKAPNRRKRAPRGAAEQAIVAALEHGSHTVSELAVVTAISGANIRGNLRRLLKERTVTRAERDGKAAYALSLAPAEA
jgi:hypothetical protein